MEIIPFDDYNHRLHPGTDFVGSVLPTWGNHALTNGWKLLEIMEPSQTKDGCWWKGKFIEAYAGFQPNVSESFNRGGLPGLSRTLKADSESHAAGVCVEYENKTDMSKLYRIRKLTPLECHRLMGVKDEDFYKMKNAGISDSQLYKLAGNSIVVDVLEAIFRNLDFQEKPLRVFEAFAGYGSQSMALRNIGVEYEVVGISEIDKYAIMAYNATHEPTTNYGDISKINWGGVPNFDFFTYSFPCTDISNAGAQAGFEEGSGTRSSLLWECRNAIVAKRPKYLMMENVKAITSKKFLPGLLRWQEFLSEQGYTNFVKVLNAKDYGVPQNRERCFIVSILGDAWYDFPEPRPLELKLKDILEDKVDEKYYLDQDRVNTFIEGLSDEKRAALEEGRTD